MKLKDSFHPYALTTSILWSLAYVLTRILGQYFGPFEIGFFRCFVSALAMLVMIFALHLKPPKLKDLKWFAASGIVGFFLYLMLFNKGAYTVTTATGNLMLAVSPVVTAVAARFLFGERLAIVQWAAIGVCFVGVAVLTLLSGGFSVNIGLMWLLLAVLAMSVYNLLLRRLSRQYPAMTIIAYSIIIGTLFQFIFVKSAFEQAAQAPVRILLLFLFLGIFSGSIAYWTWTTAFAKAKNASSVTNYMFINPFISSFFGFLFIGDKIEVSAIYGGSIIMAGLLIFNLGPVLLEKKKRKGIERPAE